MEENNNHDITAFDIPDSEEFLDLGVKLITPFWKSGIVRFGIIVVACSIVKTTGKVIIARNYAKNL